MSGHSKWSTIKRKKGALDAKRGKIFTRIIKDINISIKDGGSSDPDSNPRLRLAIANAKGANMPKDNITRAIKKAEDKGGESYLETTYEGYGVAGIALFVEASTDNLKRTVANVRAIFSKYEGSLGTNGSLEFIFDRKGVFTIPLSALEEWEMDDLEMELIDGGVEDFEKDEEMLTIFTSFEDFGNMQKKLEELKIEPESQELQRIPKTTQTVGIEEGKKILLILEKFEEDDDVNAIFHNMEMTDELMEEME
ncbi:MAG: YebC/PmpR family DNA-binding transcriptional regulator [Flavobacteriales bacterium]|nr:YebC/PmpR family DNA-binding transcriptional regulator [Flavobacteriales bacterium]